MLALSGAARQTQILTVWITVVGVTCQHVGFIRSSAAVPDPHSWMQTPEGSKEKLAAAASDHVNIMVQCLSYRLNQIRTMEIKH